VATDPDAARSSGWTRVALVRGVVLIGTGLVAVFRPDEAGVVLGAALVALSILELAMPAAAGDPTEAARRRRRRYLQVLAGTVAGVALIASSIGSVGLEAGVLAVMFGLVGAVDLWGARHANRPGIRGFRIARALVAIATGIVLFAIPGVALDIVTLLAAVGFIVVGSVSVVGILLPPEGIRTRGRGPTGIVDIADAWVRGRDVGSERRREILDAYDYDLGDRDKLVRFSVLLGLAGIIASAGLIGNSVASIIGAMIIAPLMGPIVGVAIGIVMAMPARTVRSLIVAAVGTLATILIGVAIAAWLAGPGTADNSEIVARTSPTLIDLVVALAAGAAGAYAASNARVADSLPGVAIAISLVPPLSTAGILLALGEPASAAGALLLFTTNFVSIVLAASVVLVLTGVAPLTRLVTNREQTQAWFASFVVAGILLLVPLAIGGQQAVAAADDDAAATAAVEAWLAPSPGFAIIDVSVSGQAVEVFVTGPGSPPDPAALQSALDVALGGPTQLDLRISQTVLYTTPGQGPGPSGGPGPSTSPAP
jgi:uncharacterized hydrophobic protein (TIGR00271 family)